MHISFLLRMIIILHILVTVQMSWRHIPWPRYVKVFILSFYPNARFAWSTSIDYIWLQYKLCGFPHNTWRRVGVVIRKSWGHLDHGGNFEIPILSDSDWAKIQICINSCSCKFQFLSNQSRKVLVFLQKWLAPDTSKTYTTNILIDISATPVISMGTFWPWHWCILRAWRRPDNAFHLTFTELIAGVCIIR